jgi:DNA-binding NarL/FixJ family response regulator
MPADARPRRPPAQRPPNRPAGAQLPPPAAADAVPPPPQAADVVLGPLQPVDAVLPPPQAADVVLGPLQPVDAVLPPPQAADAVLGPLQPADAVLPPPQSAFAPMQPADAVFAPMQPGPRGPAPLRVLLVDAAPMQRSGLRSVLGPGAAEIVVVGEAGNGVEAVDLARRLLPDVLITDLTLPRMDGLAVTRAIVAAGLPVRVLILTADDGDEHVLAAIAAGATGFLGKDAPPAELIAAVRALAAGGAVITPGILGRILIRVAEALPSPATTVTSKLDALTDREREVLVHVARGHSNAEIAKALLVSETTIKTHVGHVLTKLRLRDRTQAVVLAYETGLIRPGA